MGDSRGGAILPQFLPHHARRLSSLSFVCRHSRNGPFSKRRKAMRSSTSRSSRHQDLQFLPQLTVLEPRDCPSLLSAVLADSVSVSAEVAATVPAPSSPLAPVQTSTSLILTAPSLAESLNSALAPLAPTSPDSPGSLQGGSPGSPLASTVSSPRCSKRSSAAPPASQQSPQPPHPVRRRPSHWGQEMPGMGLSTARSCSLPLNPPRTP